MAIDKPLEPPIMDMMPEDDIEVELVEDDMPNSVQTTEDGGMIIDFTDEPEQDYSFDDNLAKFMDDSELTQLGNSLKEKFAADRQSRSDWEDAYVEGYKLLGFKKEKRTEPWANACSITHPLIAEAAVRFQANTIQEIFPASGPARTKLIGKGGIDLVKQGQRVERYINYVATEQMEEYREEKDRSLFSLSVTGSVFFKVYWDDQKNRPEAIFVPAADFVVPYGAVSLEKAHRYTHIMRRGEDWVRRNQLSGWFRDVELGDPVADKDDLYMKIRKESGETDVSAEEELYTLLEMHCNIDFEDFFETRGIEIPDWVDRTNGLAVPYVVTFDLGSCKVLSIRRNWLEGDEGYNKRMHFVHYQYIPGDGFYGYGFAHLIRGVAAGATSILRQLVDAGTLNNLPGGLKLRGLRVKGDQTPIRPGEWRDVDVAPNTKISDNLFPMPYKEPSGTLLSLLQGIVEEGRRFASLTDMETPNSSGDTPVGTTLAFIERNMKVQTAVAARTHASMKKELRMIAELIKTYGPDQYPYDTGDPNASIKSDFDDRVDVIPVSDPNASTQAQRIMQAQSAVQLSQIIPGIADAKKLLRYSMEAMGVPNAEEIVPLDEDIKPMDPVTENMYVLQLQPVKAFLHQDHQAHIQVHMFGMNDPKVASIIGTSPMAAQMQGAMMAHIAEHLGMMYRSDIEKNLGFQLPAPGEALPPEIEAELSGLVAQAADQLYRGNVAEEEKAKIEQEMQDPQYILQRDELAIQAAKSQADIELGYEKVELEKAKLLQKDEAEKRKEAIDAELKQIEIQARLLGDILDSATETEKLSYQERLKMSEILMDRLSKEFDLAKEKVKASAALGKSFNDSITKLNDQVSKLQVKRDELAAKKMNQGGNE